MESYGNDTSSAWLATPAGIQLQRRLTDEHTLQALDHLLARIDTLEKAVGRLTDLMEQGPGLVAMAGDMADEAYRNAAARGLNLEERLHNALHLAGQITAPETVAKLDTLVQLSDQLPGLVAMTVDMLDEGMKKAVSHGFNPDVLASVAGAANTALTVAHAEHPVSSGGPFKILRALRDPDRQKGLGFFMNFLKHFGQNL